MGYDTTVIGTTTVYAIAKCPIKGCKSRRRIVCPDMRIIEDHRARRTYTEIMVPAPGWNRDLVSPFVQHGDTPTGDSRLATDHLFYKVRVDAMTAAGLICTDHNRYLKPEAVRGVVNVDKTCDGRCMAATRASCECSCGGANHGANWA
jgi:hypothetical protein